MVTVNVAPESHISEEQYQWQPAARPDVKDALRALDFNLTHSQETEWIWL